MTDNLIESGKSLLAGEFTLLGVSTKVNDEEVLSKPATTRGVQRLDHGAVGYDEDELVRAPPEATCRCCADNSTGLRVLYLLRWCNVTDERRIMLDIFLAQHTAVDVFVQCADGYAFDHLIMTLAYLEENGSAIDDVSVHLIRRTVSRKSTAL